MYLFRLNAAMGSSACSASTPHHVVGTGVGGCDTIPRLITRSEGNHLVNSIFYLKYTKGFVQSWESLNIDGE